MDERARKILAEAWANVERIEKMEMREPTLEVPPEREAVVHRKRNLDTTPEQRQRLREEAQAETDTKWGEWFDQRFHQRLAEYMTEYSETVVAVTFKRLDAHKSALESEIKALRTELAALKEVTRGHNVVGLRHSDVA